MNLRLLQQNTRDWKRSLKTSLLVFLLALAGLVGLGLLAPSQTSPEARAQAPLSEASRPVEAQASPATHQPPLPSTPPQAGPLPAEPLPAPQTEGALPGSAWPPDSDSPTQGSTFLVRLQKTLLVLALLSLLIWGLLRLIAPRMAGMAHTPGARGKLLKVLERHSLGPGRGLMVVEVAGRHLLLGMTEHGVQTLAELDAEEVRQARGIPAASGHPASEAPATPESPRNLLGEVLSRHLSALPGLSTRQRGPEAR